MEKSDKIIIKRIFLDSKAHSLGYLQRKYDVYTGLYISVIIAFLLNLLEIIKDVISYGYDSNIVLIEFLFEFILGFILVGSISKKSDLDLLLKLKEGRFSKEKAYKFIYEMTREDLR